MHLAMEDSDSNLSKTDESGRRKILKRRASKSKKIGSENRKAGKKRKKIRKSMLKLSKTACLPKKKKFKLGDGSRAKRNNSV